MDEQKGSEPPSTWGLVVRGVGLASGIGIPFAVLVSFGALAGRHLDQRLGTSWIVVVGIVLGAAAAVVNMLRVLRYFQRDDERSETPPERSS